MSSTLVWLVCVAAASVSGTDVNIEIETDANVEIEEDAPTAAAAPSAPPPSATQPPPAAPGSPATTAASANPSRLGQNGKIEKSGLWGWGLGVELPMAGVLTGLGGRSGVGWGYNLGGALSLEITPHILIRLYGAGGETTGGSASVRYRDNDVEVLARQKAGWLGFELGLGGAYQFRSVDSPFTPYVGIDGGARFSGYTFDPETEPVRTVKEPDLVQVVGESGNDALSLGWTVAARGGVRFELTRWLATLVELQLSYAHLPVESVSNTLLARQAVSPTDDVVLIRLTFSIRLGV